MLMDYLQTYTNCVHMLVYIKDYRLECLSE